jgi:hypothetical protein
MESSTRSCSRVARMEPNGSMLQIERTSTFSRRIGANGPKAIKSNILKREIDTVLGLAKTAGSIVGNAATYGVAALAPHPRTSGITDRESSQREFCNRICPRSLRPPGYLARYSVTARSIVTKCAPPSRRFLMSFSSMMSRCPRPMT